MGQPIGLPRCGIEIDQDRLILDGREPLRGCVAGIEDDVRRDARREVARVEYPGRTQPVIPAAARSPRRLMDVPAHH